MLHSRKVREAVQNLCKEKGVNTSSKRNVGDFCDWCDDVIRMCLAHLRDLKANTQNLARALRKGTPGENDKINAMLEQVNFQESWCDGASNSTSPSTPMALEDGEVGPKNGSTAIVPWWRLHAEKQMKLFNLPSAEEEGKGSSGSGATAPCQQQLILLASYFLNLSFLLCK